MTKVTFFIFQYCTFGQLKKGISILFLVVYMFGSTEMGQLLRLPALVSHYMQHRSEDPSTGMLEFLHQHYMHAFEIDKDFNDDMKLPFKTMDNGGSSVSIFVPSAKHPSLRIYDFKLNALTIERKLKFQELLPKIDAQYNFLAKGYNPGKGIFANPMFQNNYQYGLKLAVPLRFSQGRGEYRMAKLKIQELKLDQQLKAREIEIKIKSYFNEYLNLKDQIALQSENYSNYLRLTRAEEMRFFNGESSLFLINSRENKALEALAKLVELKTKYFKTLYGMQWSAGILHQF